MELSDTALTCHLTKKNFMHAEVPQCVASRPKELQGWGEHFDILGTWTYLVILGALGVYSTSA